MQSVLIIPQLYSRFRLIPRRQRHEELTGAPYKRKWAIHATDRYAKAVEENSNHNKSKKVAQNRKSLATMKEEEDGATE